MVASVQILFCVNISSVEVLTAYGDTACTEAFCTYAIFCTRQQKLVSAQHEPMGLVEILHNIYATANHEMSLLFCHVSRCVIFCRVNICKFDLQNHGLSHFLR